MLAYSPVTHTTLSTATDAAAPSPDGSVLLRGSTGSILDATGNVWTITSDGQIAENGVTDTSTANITLLADVDGIIWTENASDLWSAKSPASSSPGMTTITVPFAVPDNINAIVGSASTDNLTSLDYSNDGGDTVLMTQSFAGQAGATGLPDGFGASGSTGDNVLQLGVHGQSQSATFAVLNGNYASLDVLALGVNGGDTLTVSLVYADGTTSSSSQFVPDWLGQGSLNRFSLWSSSVDYRAFGYGDFSFAADPSKVLTDVQVASDAGLIDILGANGNQPVTSTWSTGVPTGPLSSDIRPPASYSGDGTVFDTAKANCIGINTQSYGTSAYETTTVNAPWNTIKSVQTAPASWSPTFSDNLAYDNFVETKLDLRAAGQASLDVMAMGAKRGSVMLDDGADKFTWVANSNDNIAGLNTMAVYAGGGDDTIDLTATGLSAFDDSHDTTNGSLWDPGYQGASSIAQVYLGAGSDSVTVTGATRLFLHGSTGSANVHGGSGADTIVVGAGGGDFTGGGGADLFILAQGSGYATIEDFVPGVSKLDFKGLTSAGISQTFRSPEAGTSGLLISYGSGNESVLLANTTHIAASDMIFT